MCLKNKSFILYHLQFRGAEVHWVRPQVLSTLSLDIRNKGDKLKDLEMTNTLSLGTGLCTLSR